MNQTLGVQTPVVFAGYGITHEQYDSYKDLDLNDKIALVADGEPMNAEGCSLIPCQGGARGYTTEKMPRARRCK